MRDRVPPPAFVPALTSSSCSLRKHRQAARFLKPSRSYVRVWLGLNFILEPGSCCRCSGRHRGDPAAATPPGSRDTESRGARTPAGRAAARTRTARPGGRHDAGWDAGHCSRGAAVEAPPLLGRPPLSMEPAAAARSHSLPAAVSACAAAAAGERARLQARATRRQLEAAVPSGQRRRGCAPPPSPAFKPGPARARLLLCARHRACAPGPLLGGGTRAGEWRERGREKGGRVMASARPGRGTRPRSRALPALPGARAWKGDALCVRPGKGSEPRPACSPWQSSGGVPRRDGPQYCVLERGSRGARSLCRDCGSFAVSAARAG